MAIMEDEDGEFDAARALFEQAIQADSHHVPAWQVCNTAVVATAFCLEAQRLCCP